MQEGEWEMETGSGNYVGSAFPFPIPDLSCSNQRSPSQGTDLRRLDVHDSIDRVLRSSEQQVVDRFDALQRRMVLVGDFVAPGTEATAAPNADCLQLRKNRLEHFVPVEPRGGVP